MFQSIYHSPAGPLLIKADDTGITAINFVKQDFVDSNPVSISNSITDECTFQLQQYFSGKRTTFTVPIALNGTDFQKKVWHELQKIPFGKTVSYLEIAKALGDPNKIRAVGGANGKNPIAIIVPCHRVIGTNGNLTGYAGGIDKKRWLLNFEGSIGGDLFSM